jgi:hypothetical protein
MAPLIAFRNCSLFALGLLLYQSRLQQEAQSGRPKPLRDQVKATETVCQQDVPSPTLRCDVIWFAAESSETCTVKVIYDYTAQDDDEISLEDGETLTDVTVIDDGWATGTNRSGKRGMFPRNYCEVNPFS